MKYRDKKNQPNAPDLEATGGDADLRLDDDRLAELMRDVAGSQDEPPAGLLETLLGDIPDPLELSWSEHGPTTDEAEGEDPTDEPVAGEPANDNGPRYWRWTLAAVLLMTATLSSLMIGHLSETGGAPEQWIVQERETSEPVYSGPAPEMIKEELKTLRLGDEVLEQRRTDKIEDVPSSPTELSEASSGAPNVSAAAEGGRKIRPAADSTALRAQAVEEKASRFRARAKKVPVPAPTPADVEPDSLDFALSLDDSARQSGALEPPSAMVKGELAITAEAPLINPTSNDQAASAAMSPPPAPRAKAAPVNGKPFADSYFESDSVNPFIDTEDDALSTFGLDVDTGSYTVVRGYLNRGHLPPRQAVRVEEMVNYFDYGQAPPTAGRDDFAIDVVGAPSIYGEGDRYYLMRVGLKGREIHEEERPPALLTFVIDVSGSMNREERLGLVKQSLGLLIDELRSNDRMALVVYGTRGRVLLQPTTDKAKMRRAIDELRSEGSTNAGEGLDLAYELASRARRAGEINRLILCSDGVANTGITSVEGILNRVRDYAQDGVELTTVGFGMGNYNDFLMEQLADRGNGRYAYVDGLKEAERIFVENLTGTLQTLAAEARSQVEMNPEVVSRYRLLGYENRDIADHRFRDDTVDAGEIGMGHTVTALYEIKTHKPLRRSDRVATVRLRYASVARQEMVEQKAEVTGRDFVKSWEKAPVALRLASLVAELAEILRGSHWAREGDPADVLERLHRVRGELRHDERVAELVALTSKVVQLKGERPDR